MNTLNKAQKESFINIIDDIVEQAREQKAGIYFTDYKYSMAEITREALENFEDELEEGADEANEESKLIKEESNHDQPYHSNKEAKVFAETQARQAVALLKVFSADPHISSHFTNEIKYYIKYWCKQEDNAELNTNRIITIVDKILKLINRGKL